MSDMSTSLDVVNKIEMAAALLDGKGYAVHANDVRAAGIAVAGLIAKAKALRVAQKEYMADRGNQAKGQTVGKAALELDDALACLSARSGVRVDDSERLDWLEKPDGSYWVEVQAQPDGRTIYAGNGRGLRIAIDSVSNIK